MRITDCAAPGLSIRYTVRAPAWGVSNAAIDGGVTITRSTTMDAHLSEALTIDRLTTRLVGLCGLIALLMRLYADRPPEEILANPPTVLDRIGLGDLQSVPQRRVVVIGAEVL